MKTLFYRNRIWLGWFALVVVAGLIQGCAPFKRPYSGNIYIDHPQVFTRERLINRRLDEQAWLENQLKTDAAPSLQGSIDTRDFMGLAAAVKGNFDPLGGAQTQAAIQDTQQGSRLNDLQNQLQTEILKKQIAAVQNSTDGQAVPATTNVITILNGGTNQLTIGTVNLSFGPFASNSLPQFLNPSNRVNTTANLTSIETLDDKLAYRNAIQALLREQELDDTHDLNGMTLYTLKFDISVIPGQNNPSFGQVSLTMGADRCATNNNLPKVPDYTEYQTWVEELNHELLEACMSIERRYYMKFLTDEEKDELFALAIQKLNGLPDELARNLNSSSRETAKQLAGSSIEHMYKMGHFDRLPPNGPDANQITDTLAAHLMKFAADIQSFSKTNSSPVDLQSITNQMTQTIRSNLCETLIRSGFSSLRTNFDGVQSSITNLNHKLAALPAINEALRSNLAGASMTEISLVLQTTLSSLEADMHTLGNSRTKLQINDYLTNSTAFNKELCAKLGSKLPEKIQVINEAIVLTNKFLSGLIPNENPPETIPSQGRAPNKHLQKLRNLVSQAHQRANDGALILARLEPKLDALKAAHDHISQLLSETMISAELAGATNVLQARLAALKTLNPSAVNDPAFTQASQLLSRLIKLDSDLNSTLSNFVKNLAPWMDSTATNNELATSPVTWPATTAFVNLQSNLFTLETNLASAWMTNGNAGPVVASLLTNFSRLKTDLDSDVTNLQMLDRQADQQLGNTIAWTLIGLSSNSVACLRELKNLNEALENRLKTYQNFADAIANLTAPTESQNADAMLTEYICGMTSLSDLNQSIAGLAGSFSNLNDNLAWLTNSTATLAKYISPKDAEAVQGLASLLQSSREKLNNLSGKLTFPFFLDQPVPPDQVWIARIVKDFNVTVNNLIYTNQQINGWLTDLIDELGKDNLVPGPGGAHALEYLVKQRYQVPLEKYVNLSEPSTNGLKVDAYSFFICNATAYPETTNVDSGYQAFINCLITNRTVWTPYVTVVEPKQYAQNISDVAARERVISLAASLSALIPQANTSLGLESSYVRDSQQMLDTIKRSPLLVGYANGATNFGWILGPKFSISDSDSQPAWSQVPVQYSVEASVVVPSWWNNLTLTATNWWLDKRMTPKRIHIAGTNSFTVQLPKSYSGLTRFFLSATDQKLLQPSILPRWDPLIARQHITVQEGKNEVVLIRGQDLWRNPKVFIGSQAAVSVNVLPDMGGIVAAFSNVQLPASAIPGPQLADLSVITSGGSSVLRDGVQILPDTKISQPAFASLQSTYLTNGGSLLFEIDARQLPASYGQLYVQLNDSRDGTTVLNQSITNGLPTGGTWRLSIPGPVSGEPRPLQVDLKLGQTPDTRETLISVLKKPANPIVFFGSPTNVQYALSAINVTLPIGSSSNLALTLPAINNLSNLFTMAFPEFSAALAAGKVNVNLANAGGMATNLPAQTGVFPNLKFSLPTIATNTQTWNLQVTYPSSIPGCSPILVNQPLTVTVPAAK